MDNGFVVKVELVTAAWSILGSVLSVFDTIDEPARDSLDQESSEKRTAIFSALDAQLRREEQIKPVVEKNGSKKSGW